MQDQLEHIVNFLAYLGVTLPLIGLGFFIFMIVTPYSEFKLMRAGSQLDNQQAVAAAKAATNALGGKIVGLSLVLASAVYHSVSLWDLLVWGIVGVVFQVVIFYLFEWVTPFAVVKEIPQGNVAVGMFSAFLSVSSGLVMAALISY